MRPHRSWAWFVCVVATAGVLSSSAAACQVTGSAPAVPSHADIVIAAAGDLACAPAAATTPNTCQQRAVAAAIADDPAVSAFLALGDLQYDAGTTEEFVSYDESYGVLRSVTFPAVGNHEYGTPAAAGYFAYFGVAANPPDGWYGFDLGATWRVVVLNSNCGEIGCASGSRQEQWVRNDLAASGRTCAIAMWHHPRFSSGSHHGSDRELAPLWRAIDDLGVDVVLNGHEHNYERFDPLDAGGSPSASGPREFVVGTGGASQYEFGVVAEASAARIAGEFGYLRLTLSAESYEWAFVGVDGDVLDSGRGDCT